VAFVSTTQSGSTATKPGLLARLILFIRQIVSELKKVVRPTRSEMTTYASVVLVFVGITMAFIFLIDAITGWGIGQIF
jgi:preprotein translocase subunit SecE